MAADPPKDPGRRGMMVDQPVAIGTGGKGAEAKGAESPLPPMDLRTVAPPGEYHLPPLPPDNTDHLAAQGTITVNTIRVTGSTVFSEQELAEVTAPYLGRKITLNELFELRDRLTHMYIDRGYASSGATLPDQKVSGGDLEIRVVEGSLTSIEVSGNAFLAEGWLKNHLQAGVTSPLNIHQLEERFQLLRQNEMVKSVQSELRPGVQPGEAILNVHVEEANPLRVGVTWDNAIAPNLGTQQYGLEAADRSLFGWNDVLSGRLGLSNGKGMSNYDVSYALPLNAKNTTLSLENSKTLSTVMFSPFRALNITSLSHQNGVSLRHPFLQTPNDEIAASIGFQRRDSQTSLLGQAYDLTPGTTNGHSVVQVVNLGQEWVHRAPVQVLAASSMFSKGMDWGDATVNSSGLPDGRFLAWRGQFQWVRQLETFASQLQLRMAMRLTNSPMLATEKFSLGGMDTVRGYREDLIARDNGLVTNLDWRVPLPWRLPVPWLGRAETDGGFSAILFSDFGEGWDHGSLPADPKNLSSSGVGFSWAINPSSQVMIYLAKPWRTTPIPTNQRVLEDRGINFRINIATY